ncbi:MAG: CBS domain-containing protein [Deltaproteobacteria bacterium]|nr:CBS domain-containing protein [Deltaproteobacteria bacterium]
MLTARDIMTTEVITIGPRASVEDLAALLETRRIGGVPVVDGDGNLVGIVTQSDLVQRCRDLELPPALNILDLHIYLETPSGFQRRLEKMLGTTVGDVMTRDPLTIAPETPVPEIADLMAERRVHSLPVMAEGKLVGIVGKIDLIRALAHLP